MVTYIKDSRASVVRCIRSVPGSITADRLNNMQIRFAPIQYIYIYVYTYVYFEYARIRMREIIYPPSRTEIG